MPDLNQLFFVAFVSVVLSLILASGIGIFPCEPTCLGDEVTTTDRYTELFNDSFSGWVVAKDDGMYTVMDETGAVREFDGHWLAKCGEI